MQRKMSLPLPQKINFSPTMNHLNAAGWLQILQKKMMVIPLEKDKILESYSVVGCKTIMTIFHFWVSTLPCVMWG